MGKNLLKLFCCILLALPSAFADEVVEGTTGLEGTGTSEPTGSYTTPAIKDSADNASGQNSGAQTMSYLMGGMFIATGTPMAAGCPESPSCPVGIMLIGMGIMSFMQGDANGKASGDADNTAGLTNSYGSTSAGKGSGKSSTVKAVEAQVKGLEQAGILDSKTGTIKVPNSNKTYKVSDFADAGAMAAAGFPPGAVSGAMNAAARAEKSAKAKAIRLGAMTAANGYAEGGGGGGAGGLAAAGDYNAGFGAGAGGAGAGKLGRDPAQVAGMQKNFNGEPIGVASDSIFLMMKRRYKVKEGQDSFFTDMDLRIQK